MGEKNPIEEEIREESWVKQYWRPLMAYQYFAVCLFDFIIAPIMTMLLSKYLGFEYKPWEPLTLKETGYYHMSMGAIIGVAAWTRGYEKIKRLEVEGSTSLEVERNHTTQIPTPSGRE